MFRAVHACWDNKNISFLKKALNNNRLTDDLIYRSVKKKKELYEAIDETLKGKEISMPEGKSFPDKDGSERTKIRIRWWEDPSGMTYRTFSVEPLQDLPDKKIDLSLLKDDDYYKKEEKIVFFGHYWLKGEPSLFRENICCLDYSVANNGHLVAYRFDEELKLDSRKFVFVKSITLHN